MDGRIMEINSIYINEYGSSGFPALPGQAVRRAEEIPDDDRRSSNFEKTKDIFSRGANNNFDSNVYNFGKLPKRRENRLDEEQSVADKTQNYDSINPIERKSNKAVSEKTIDAKKETAETEKPAEEIKKNDSANKPKTPGVKELSDSEKEQVKELEKIDRAVRAHEAAHLAAGGGLVRGGASYSYTTGPDGKQYVTGGEVSIDTSPVPGDPRATIRKMQQVRQAALAPIDPSGQDRAVAAAASQAEAKAQMELMKENTEKLKEAFGGEKEQETKKTDSNNQNDKPIEVENEKQNEDSEIDELSFARKKNDEPKIGINSAFKEQEQTRNQINGTNTKNKDSETKNSFNSTRAERGNRITFPKNANAYIINAYKIGETGGFTSGAIFNGVSS